MNTDRTAPRLISLALAAMITASMLAGIDTLARSELATTSLMAQASAQARQALSRRSCREIRSSSHAAGLCSAPWLESPCAVFFRLEHGADR